MQSNQNKGKLQLKKQAISNLSIRDLANLKGGNEEAWTTSRRSCTGFLCCEPETTITIITNITCSCTTQTTGATL